MTKIISNTKDNSPEFNFDALTRCISAVHIRLQATAVNSVNRCLTVRNWLIGRYIVEYEQRGNDRAEYGARLLQELVGTLQIRGINVTLLKNARRFYLTYPYLRVMVDRISPMPSDLLREAQLEPMPFNGIEVPLQKSPTASDKFRTPAEALVSRLSFSHIIELLTIEDDLVRFFYEFESIRNVWSVKELRRQISTNLHIRVGLSKSPEKIKQKLSEMTQKQNASLQVKDPMTLEFLGLNASDHVTEDDLENSLISHLQEFLLELGKGFCFEARQKRMIIDDRYYFADLVFYNRLLHCNVIIELKNDEFKHSYLSQLNSYVSYFRENEMQPGDNLPVGILLCTRKGKKMVEYALAGIENSIFVSTYQLCLPDRKQLEDFLKNAMQ